MIETHKKEKKIQ